MKTKAVLLILFSCLLNLPFANAQRGGNPMHMFFEYGPMKSVENLATKSGNYFLAAGIKVHSWKEEKPMQFEIDMNVRGISYVDSSSSKKPYFWMCEMYMGPRLMISKTSPLYPTFSVLGGGYYGFECGGNFNAIASLGLYYNFTKAGMDRNGISCEVTYRPAKILFKSREFQPPLGIRLGFFF